MARTRKAAAQTTEATEQQTGTAVSATETSTPQASAELTAEQLYIGKLAAQLIAPNHHNMAPEHIEARCTEALAKAEVLLATLKARYAK